MTIYCFSIDEGTTEALLKGFQQYTSMSGLLQLEMPRDAFITALCKASLPPHYALTKSFDSGKTWVADASLMHIDWLGIKIFTLYLVLTSFSY